MCTGRATSIENESNTRHFINENSTSVTTPLKIVSPNTSGLKSKQINPDFCSFVEKNDILGFQERKLDSLDTVVFNNYEHRKQFMRQKSGGLFLAVKSSFTNFIHALHKDNKLVILFVLSKKLTKTNDLLFGLVYVPPENSDFATDDPLVGIQQELDSLTDKHKPVCMFGD